MSASVGEMSAPIAKSAGSGERPRKGGDAGRRRVLVVDDHPVFREGLVQRINRESDLVVCGEAGDAQEAMASVERHLPELVLMDISLPGRGGLEMIKDISARYPDIPVVALSMHDEAVYGERVLRAGGRGYVSKSDDAAKMLAAIRRVLQGGVYLSEATSAAMLGSLAGQRTGGAPSRISRLTDRELEVLALIGTAMGTGEIAERLHMSIKTVDAHRANIKRKLGLASGPELVRYAVLWAESGE